MDSFLSCSHILEETVSTDESGEQLAEPIPFQQYQTMAPFFLKRTGGQLGHRHQKMVELMSSILELKKMPVCCSPGSSVAADSSVYCRPYGVCRQYTSHVTFFCTQCAC